jgi:sec-independent protein translocase protein TatB
MFDIGWTELVVIGVVALIVIGPRDLPEMFRTLGRFTAKARTMAREFQRAMEQAAKETGVSDVARDVKDATSARNLGLDAVKDAASKFEKWDPLKNAAKPTPPSPPKMPATPQPVSAPAEAAPPAPGATAAPTAPEADLPAPAAPAVGPNTKALAEKRAAKSRIAREAAAQMRAVSATPDEKSDVP